MAEQNFFLESIDFEDILEDALIDGEAIEIARIVELTIESPYSDGPRSIKAIWPRIRSRLSSFSSGISGIVDDFEDGFAFQLRSVAAFEEGKDGVGVKLTGINSEVGSEDDQLFLVFEYHEDLEDFINFDYPIRLKSENPITDNRVWSKPVLKLDNFVMEDSIEIVPEPVPELGTISGLGVVAALCIAVWWAMPTNLAMLRRRSPMKERNMLQRFTPARATTFAKVYRKDNNNFIDKSTQQLKIATEYFSLAILPELSDAEADRLEEILELAQFDEHLSSLINKIDCFVLEELKYFEPDELDRDNNQIARIKEFLVS